MNNNIFCVFLSSVFQLPRLHAAASPLVRQSSTCFLISSPSCTRFPVQVEEVLGRGGQTGPECIDGMYLPETLDLADR